MLCSFMLSLLFGLCQEYFEGEFRRAMTASFFNPYADYSTEIFANKAKADIKAIR